jgi:SecD/SecF fusion protein
MQGKGLIKWFLILIALVCVLQFIYFIPTNRVEADAAAYAEKIGGSDTKSAAFKIARAKYLDSMSTEEIFSIPLIKKYTYNELKQQQLALGLDLKGGMSAVLQVDLEDFLKSLAGKNQTNTEFTKALANAKEKMKTSQSDYITLFSQEFRAIAGDNKMNRIFGKAEALGSISNTTDDGTITRLLRTKANETVNTTFDRLKKRIDKLGVTQPNISLDASRDLIVVEMPGIDNPQRARDFLSTSAKLEFWETFRNNDAGIAAAFQAADAKSKSTAPAAPIDSTSTAPIKVDSVATPVYDSLGNVIDTVMKAATATDIASPASASGALLSALTLVPKPGSVIIGQATKGKMGTINGILDRPDVKALFPANSKFMWSDKPSVNAEGITTNLYDLYLIKKQGDSDVAQLDGDVVTSATQTLDPNTGKVEVILRMNAQGAKTWGNMTTKASNDGNREIAISLDNEIISAPSVRQPITGGVSSITGNYTVEEAIDFAGILEVGKLPAKPQIIQENTVGPSLGAENISKSLKALSIGFLIVIATMIFYYGGAGIVSILALLLNVFLIFGTLSSLGTVLTLPGIAGIVLTIGMAVDANVIIFERIKEELRDGKSVKDAVADGFYHSYSSIIDANVTTLITAMILAYFGLGPVRGFAVVLIIGVLSSMFTAVLVTRMMIEWWLNRGKTLSFWNASTKESFAHINVDWIKLRKPMYIASAVLTLIGVVSIFTKGFDLGVEYQGGYSYNVQFAGTPPNADQLREGLTAPFGISPVVKAVDNDNTFNITTSYLVNDNAQDAGDQVLAKLHEGINQVTKGNVSIDDFKNAETGDDKTHIVTSTKVGPVIADDLKQTSMIAVVLALLAIFIYILMRFNKWQYSVGAIISLMHDTLMVIGIFSLLKGLVGFTLEVDQAFIAAILTVIGYSINDTVIVYDRIRENVGLYPTKSNAEIINSAINSTLSRTTLTSFTTWIVIFILFIFGGDSIKGFAFALTIGLLVGTYSSIFIASPIVYDLTDDLRMGSRSKA